MSDLLKNIIRFVVFLLVQVFLLNRIPPLHRFISPYLYFLFILWLPFKMPRLALTLVGFFFGLCLDIFTKTPGLHAAACTLIAYVRPFLITLLMPKEIMEINYAEPSIKSMGWMQYSVYILVLTSLHHTWLVFLEWLEVGDILYFLGKVMGTLTVSLLLILITEMIFPRKARYRNNSA